MPTVQIADRTIQCQHGENLRRVLMNAGVPLYNGIARGIHCRGLGTCGTCAVRVDGEISETTRIERWRLNFPPHDSGSGLRLACQAFVLGDVRVQKWSGLWGNQMPSQQQESAD